MEDDDTIRVAPAGKPPAPAPAKVAAGERLLRAQTPDRGLLAVLVLVLVSLGAMLGWVLWPVPATIQAPAVAIVAPAPPAVDTVVPPRLVVPPSGTLGISPVPPDASAVLDAPAPMRPVPPPAGPATYGEDEILGLHPTAPRMVRLRDAPGVFVLLFPDLENQGATLNRVAALVEKRGQPRDRVLGDAELAVAIAGSGATPATYYYGHNYRGRDLIRFFALAQAQGITLTAQELWLRAQLDTVAALGFDPAEVAFLGIPGLDQRVDARMRRAILRHETGHGHFFTNPDFAAHIRRVWHEMLTPADRAALTDYLARVGYDPSLEELMINEAMAYLLFTPDPRFFSDAETGLPPGRILAIRRMFLGDTPLLAGQRE